MYVVLIESRSDHRTDTIFSNGRSESSSPYGSSSSSETMWITEKNAITMDVKARYQQM